MLPKNDYGKGVFKSFSMFAPTLDVFSFGFRKHSRYSGKVRKLKILYVLAISELPLSPKEIVSRTGIPRRSVFYYLKYLRRMKYVERIGNGNSTVYTISELGLHYLKECIVQTNLSVGYGCFRFDRLNGMDGGDVVGDVVYQRMGGGFGEVGFRVGFGGFRRLLSLLGFRVGSRLKRVVMYVKRGVLHFDFCVNVPRDVALRYGLWLVKERVFAFALCLFSILKWMGLGEEDVLQLFRMAPELRMGVM